ncbi:MAG: hypothetical protein LBC59_09620 [Chitinispirillales bacterium]|jgi:hypothetical protein|nr:hypothetical protein [Chitinispirillales bacterium]
MKRLLLLAALFALLSGCGTDPKEGQAQDSRLYGKWFIAGVDHLCEGSCNQIRSSIDLTYEFNGNSIVLTGSGLDYVNNEDWPETTVVNQSNIMDSWYTSGNEIFATNRIESRGTINWSWRYELRGNDTLVFTSARVKYEGGTWGAARTYFCNKDFIRQL